jgi:hypothetical protein
MPENDYRLGMKQAYIISLAAYPNQIFSPTDSVEEA